MHSNYDPSVTGCGLDPIHNPAVASSFLWRGGGGRDNQRRFSRELKCIYLEHIY